MPSQILFVFLVNLVSQALSVYHNHKGYINDSDYMVDMHPRHKKRDLIAVPHDFTEPEKSRPFFFPTC